MNRALSAMDQTLANTAMNTISGVDVDDEASDDGGDIESIKSLLCDYLDGITENPSTSPEDDDQSKAFGDLLAQWVAHWRKNGDYGTLVYMLVDRNEEYKDRELGLKALEAGDRRKAHFLEARCRQRSICLYLAKIRSTIDCRVEKRLEPKIAISLHGICELNGGSLTDKEIRLETESVIQAKSFTDKRFREVDSQKSYPTPVDGTSPLATVNTRVSEGWALLMVPEGHKLRFLTDNANAADLNIWIARQTELIQTQNGKLEDAEQKTRWALARVCKTQINNIRSFTYGSNSSDPKKPVALETVIHASLKLQDTILLQDALTVSPRELPLTLWEEIGSNLDLRRFSDYQNGINQALVQIHSFQDRYIVLQSILSGYKKIDPDTESQPLQLWISDKIEDALREIRQVEENDGRILATIGAKYGKDFLNKKAIPFAKKSGSHHAFALAFAIQLYDEGASKNIDTEIAKSGIREVLSTTFPMITIRSATTHIKHPIVGLETLRDANHSPQSRWSVSPDCLADLLDCCINLNLKEEEFRILQQLWLETSSADAEALQYFFLPFVKRLRQIMQDHNISPSTRNYPNYLFLFQQTISMFIIRYIGKEPFLPVNAALPYMGCGKQKIYCHGCSDLDDFLQHPEGLAGDIIGNGEMREHVKSRLLHGELCSPTHVGYLDSKTILTGTEPSNPEAVHTLRVNKWFTRPIIPEYAWKQRVYAANDMIQDIAKDEEWKLLLGDKYDECMQLRAVML